MPQKIGFLIIVDEVSMDRIAEDLELSKTTLYLYFKNKPSLYFAVVIRGVIILRDVFKEAVKNEKTGLEKIKSIIFAFYDYVQTFPEYYRLNLSVRVPRFMKMLQSIEKGDPEIENGVEYGQLKKELLDIIVDAINLGIKDGTLRKDLDPIQTVMFIGSTIEDMVYLSPVNQLLLELSGATLENYLKHSIDLLLQGIAGKSKEKE
ncbi:MAG: TetR/AcrR family transcriptional regulator [Candidatus Lokiarchaeota archaeon]